MRNLKKLNEAVAVLKQADRGIEQAVNMLPAALRRQMALNLGSVRAALHVEMAEIEKEIRKTNREEVLGRKFEEV